MYSLSHVSRDFYRHDADLEVIAKKSFKHLKIGDVVALSGDLGVGKTSFARSIIRLLLDSPDLKVSSPTFCIVNTYGSSKNNLIYHFDLYRLSRKEDLIELGIDDALSEGISIIEWPELAKDYLPVSTGGVYWVEMSMSQGDDNRTLDIYNTKAHF
jgi:tRNA threonylcarbamoyl adenosine modification protein YjeE